LINKKFFKKKVSRKGKQRQERVSINEERRKGWDLKKILWVLLCFCSPY